MNSLQSEPTRPSQPGATPRRAPGARLSVVACLLAAGLGALPGGCAMQKKTPDAVLTTDERRQRADELAALGDAARTRGDVERAIELYRESIEYAADFPDVWNNLGLLLLENEQFDKALSAFSVAADLNPEDPRPYNNMGITNLKIGWAEVAIEDFHKALAISPTYLPALRGAIRAADLLSRAEYEDLDRIRRALLAERDPEWRKYLERQRYLIESRLRSNATGRVPPANAGG